MGSIIALAFAAKHSKSVKSITLVAPPYFPSKDGVEFTVMNRLTPKRLWPPHAFLSSIMVWGVKLMDQNLETLIKSRTKVHVVMGTKDKSVPPDCANNMKKKFPAVELNNIANAGHRSVVFRRKKDFAEDLFKIWENAAASHHHES
ncbi:hydrolase, alpha/beta family protein [Corchorus olitorius]|uniref:Hydrolase, alpha/beta family protein n=1 Tax=Corchorus olitorius TaxID=93759 RepID=A0A1R3KSR3_9ROSI|nr:hydrolase, alpha/beta family protein [Corchorus olitorius]